MEAIMRPYISDAWVSDKFGFNEETIEVKGKPAQLITLEGEFQRAEKPNKNNRIYSEALLQRETNKLRDSIKMRNGHPMGMDHPMPKPTDPPQIQMQQIKRIGLENACALTTALEMNGGVVYGKAIVITGDYGTGDKLAAFVRKGFRPAVSSRGMGGDPIMQGNYLYVPESYQMICYDFVTDPSTHNAILEQAFHEEVMFLESLKHPKRQLWEVLISLSEKHSKI